jgi:hypothetical protein
MTLTLIVVLLTLALIFAAASINALKIIRHQVEPALSTWLIFLAGTSTSFLSYLVSSRNNYSSGVLMGADVMGDIIVILSIVFFGITRWKLKPFEKYYLLGLGLIILFWLLSHDAFHSNLLTQLLLSLGYLPTMHTIIKFKRNTESILVWTLILAASLISIYPAFGAWQNSHNILALIYSVRSVVLVGLSVLLMLFYKQKTYKSK